MITHEAQTFLARLNALTVDMQRALVLDDARSERVDDGVVPMLMDASDILFRIFDTDD